MNSLFLLTWFVACALSVSRAKALVLIESPTFAVASPGNNALGVLYIRNTDTNPVSVEIGADDFVSTTTGHGLGSSILFLSQNKWMPILDVTGICSGVSYPIQIQLTNIWEAGDSKAWLLTNGNPFATITASHVDVPFNISIAGALSLTNEIVFVSKQGASLVVSNADAMTYPIRWELTAGGRVLTNGLAKLPPSSEALLANICNDEVFSGKLNHLVSEQLCEALLTLQLVFTNQTFSGTAKGKLVHIHFRLPMSSVAKDILAAGVNVWVLLLLILGAALSWALNLTLPNVKHRATLKAQIASLAERTHNLSTQIDSSLRVLLRVQRMRLGNGLGRVSAWSPATTNILDTVQVGVATLDRQLALVERIDRIYDVLTEQKTNSMSISTLEMVEDAISQACRLLRATSPTEADLQSAGPLILNAESRLIALVQTDDVLALGLSRRIKTVRARLLEYALSKPDALRDVLGLLPGLRTKPTTSNQADANAELSPDNWLDPIYEQVSNVTQDLYKQLETKSRKLDLVLDYIQVLSNGQANEDRNRLLKARGQNLIKLLKMDGYVYLKQSKRVVQEMQEDIYAEDIKLELAYPSDSKTLVVPHATIEIGQTVARQFDPVQFRVTFRRQDINSSVARDEFVYEWNFGNQFVESGKALSIWHFFIDPAKSQPIKVIIYDGQDGTLVAALSKTIDVELTQSENSFYFSDKAWAESLRVAIALLAPMLALVAGAREKILGQDFLTSAIAIFLMGFTANAIKDLLTQGAPNSATKPANT